MKKILDFSLILTIIFSSFYLTTRIIAVYQEEDEIMLRIKEEAKASYIAPKDAYIDKVWGIIPGLNGLEVDIKRSYQKMKPYNVYNPKYLLFKEIKPKVSIFDLKKQPIFLGNPKKKTITFMINVAWGEEYIPKILDILDQNRVKASFFVDGAWLDKNKELGLEIFLRGHDLLNHGYLHHDVTKLSNDQIKREIVKTNDLIYNLTLTKPLYFTPPSGAYNDNALEVCDNLNMKLVMFSADTIDWQKPSVDTIIRRALTKSREGSILLMHPTENTVLALDKMIELLEKKGFVIDKISNHLSSKR